MNKIILENDKIITQQSDSFKYTFENNEILGINILNIEIIKDTDIELEYNFNEFTKIEVIITLNENIACNIYEKITGENTKIRTKYILKENSNLNISKFNNIKQIKEYIIIYLEGKKSNIKYVLKTISTGKQKYDIITYHNNIETNSEIISNGVNLDEGILTFNVSSFVPNNNKNCNVSQINRIVNLTNNECIIKPNLYIDEYEVSANHSALIKTFDEKELFYLQSRGISKKESIKLLLKGFLISNLEVKDEEKQNIIETIETYWR